MATERGSLALCLLQAVGLARLRSPPAHQSQLSHRLCWWCPCCPLSPRQRNGWPWVCQGRSGVERDKVETPGSCSCVRPEKSAAVFHLLLWLSSGFSGARWEDRSCRKFAIASLSAVGFLDSHPIVSAFPWHVNAWMRGGGNETADGGHFESQVVSAPTEGLILNMQIIFSSTFPSSC